MNSLFKDIIIGQEWSTQVFNKYAMCIIIRYYFISNSVRTLYCKTLNRKEKLHQRTIEADLSEEEMTK